MARTPRTRTTSKPAAAGMRRGIARGSRKLVTKSTPAKPRSSAAAASVAKSRRPAAAATPITKVSKDELRTQVEKLERTVATLRARSREAVRAAKQAAATIEELEARLATFERAKPPPASASPRRTRAPRRADLPSPDPKPARSGRGNFLSLERDPGDAVPPGVAVEEAEPMDEEAATAFENLHEHLHPEESSSSPDEPRRRRGAKSKQADEPG